MTSTGTSFLKQPDFPGSVAPLRIGGADHNGDGKTDLANRAALGPIPDLLTSVTTSTGGRTSVAYLPSTRWVNQQLPFVVQTVSSVTRDDGRGTVATTGFTYAGGLWHWGERQFLGFRSSKVRLPCIAGETACPGVDLYFRQELGAVGRPERVQHRTGAGTLMREITHSYTVNSTTPPFRAVNTGSLVTDHAQ